MMAVRLLTLLAGPEGVFHPGEVLQLSDEAAQQLVRAGYAEPIGEVVTATAEPQTEKAVKPKSRRR